ncbi:MAG: ribonuclease P protein component [Sedimentisphaerales bacterium]|nr:ribonuclease P protein component [Sedimentisphaerales bacterium]
MERFFFKKDQRLKTNEQFKRVLSGKCCVSNDLFRLYAVSNNVGFARLGVSVGKSSGNAVYRNRLKRLVRETFRVEQHNIPTNYDFLLIFSSKMTKKSGQSPPKKVEKLSFEQVRSSFLGLVQEAVRKAVER